MAYKPDKKKCGVTDSLNLGIMIKLLLLSHYVYVLCVAYMHVWKCVPVWSKCICASACMCR